MKLSEMNFTNEVREGFFIPGMVKRSWGIQIQVLLHVIEICNRHNIQWFACYGTLLGAVRHKGFIPWDDDLDIGMLREDYDRFNEYAQAELPEEYKVLNLKNESGYKQFITRVVSGSYGSTSSDYLMGHLGFPYVAGIDIFPFDNLYDDEAKEADRKARIQSLYELYEKIRGIDSLGAIKLLHQIEDVITEHNEEDSDYVGVLQYYARNENYTYKREQLRNLRDYQFESIIIKGPVEYDEILRLDYGDWTVINRCGGDHEYPFYSKQEQMLINNNISIPYCFKYTGQDIEKFIRRKTHLVKVDDKASHLDLMEKYHRQLISFLEGGELSAIADMLTLCQKVAIDIGTSVDTEYGEGTQMVSYLEKYCEDIYLICQSITNGDDVDVPQMRELLDEYLKVLWDEYRCLLRKRRIVLFLPVRSADWKWMQPLYEDMISEDDTEVYVMPLPYSKRKHDGNMIKVEIDCYDFPENISVVDFAKFDFNKIHVDTIVIQNPYDQYESGFTVYPKYYAEYIHSYCENLIYIHSFELGYIDRADEKSWKNARQYVLMPGVIYADKVYVPNENLKEVYDTILSDAANQLGIELQDKVCVYNTENN